MYSNEKIKKIKVAIVIIEQIQNINEAPEEIEKRRKGDARRKLFWRECSAVSKGDEKSDGKSGRANKTLLASTVQKRYVSASRCASV